jgi:hypothetical protein
VYFLSTLFCCHRLVQTDERKGRSRGGAEAETADILTAAQNFTNRQIASFSISPREIYLHADKDYIRAHA